MHRFDNTKLAQKILSWIGKEASFPVTMSCDMARSGEIKEADIEIDHGAEQCCSGGYNEAFIFEHWAGYGPRH